MSIISFDPDYRRLERQVNRMFDDFFGDIGRRTTGGDQVGSLGWSPRVEAYEKDNNFVVNAELPGIPKEKVNVDVRENTLVISGENTQSEEYKKGGTYYSERRYGAFSRSIPLPSNLKAEETKAKFENGILNVIIPKSPAGQTKKIEIS